MVSIPLNKVTTVTGGAPGAGQTKYEELIITPDSSGEASGAVWLAQIFKANTGHTLTGVKLMLFADDEIGTVTVAIQALSGGDPDGTDLSTSTINTTSLPATATGALTEISMQPVVLSVGVSYAIVVRSNADGVKWESDGSTPGYADGNKERSVDSGGTWVANTAVDQMFEEWGFA